MRILRKLFDNNAQWSEKIRAEEPHYFEELAKAQTPDFLWIGCSDSRIPAETVVGLAPGELFVHRNIANLVIHSDMNLLSVLQYSVEVLQVKHAIVCGHYGCGGVKASMENSQLGLVDNWLRYIRDVYQNNDKELDNITDGEQRCDRLVELNVMHQVKNLCHTATVQNAWHQKQPLTIHGWVYDLKEGLLKDLDCCISDQDQLEHMYHLGPKT